MRESLRLNGLEATDDAVRRLAEALVRGYQVACDELAAQGRALPGTAGHAHYARRACRQPGNLPDRPSSSNLCPSWFSWS